MRMMDWDKLRIFREVARAGKLSTASEILGISQSALSRQISALEYGMSTQLFHRHARGIILTEKGNILYKAVEEMGRELEGATTRIQDDKLEAAGRLRVTTTVGFGTLWLVPRLPALFARHPHLEIDLVLEERVLDLSMREADVAIRMKEPSQSDLVRRRLMQSRLRLYCSLAFIDSHGMPRHAEDLNGQRIASFAEHQTSAGSKLIRRLNEAIDLMPMTINNYYGVLQCVRNGLGAGVLPDYLHQHFQDMVQILPEFESDDVPIYLAYPSELRDSRKLQVFRDFILDQARHDAPDCA